MQFMGGRRRTHRLNNPTRRTTRLSHEVCPNTPLPRTFRRPQTLLLRAYHRFLGLLRRTG
jgi:hypothetical protein